jgi:release factor glutamine methyltransferase
MAETLGGLIRQARQALASARVADAALDSRLIVEALTGTTRAEAIADPDRPIAAAKANAVADAVRRRLAGEPVHRILGFRAFHGLTLALSPDTLEPRPDTETLVDAVLPFVRATAGRLGRCRILDLGTGSGAIALALLKEVPGAAAEGVDISPGALATAATNAAAAGLGGRFRPLHSHWYSATEGRYHLIVANPPYIRSEELASLQPEVRLHDPVQALDGGHDGLDAFREIASGADAHLEPGGKIALEIGHDQKMDVSALFERAGFSLAEAVQDLSGHTRALLFSRRAA